MWGGSKTKLKLTTPNEAGSNPPKKQIYKFDLQSIGYPISEK